MIHFAKGQIQKANLKRQAIPSAEFHLIKINNQDIFVDDTL